MSGDDAEGFSVEQVAAIADVPVRTVTYYVSCGLLPPPTRRGRRSRYSQAHVDRLCWIAAAQERGLSIKVMQEVLVLLEMNEDISLREWLAVPVTKVSLTP